MASSVSSRLSERQFVLLYLLTATLVLTILGGWVLVRTYGGYPTINARLLAEKIDREQSYFEQQRRHLAIIDSAHHAIAAYHSDVTAVFIESEIEEQIKEVRRTYTANDSLLLFRAFDQTANFYQMMYRDKKLLSSKKHNISLFAKRLEDCRLGYQAAPTPANPAAPAKAARP